MAARRGMIMAALAAIALSGCSAGKDAELPKTELPSPPKSSEIPCVPLSEMEEQACLKERPEARRVCMKAEVNEILCTDQQNFIRRLYQGRHNN